MHQIFGFSTTSNPDFHTVCNVDCLFKKSEKSIAPQEDDKTTPIYPTEALKPNTPQNESFYKLILADSFSPVSTIYHKHKRHLCLYFN